MFLRRLFSSVILWSVVITALLKGNNPVSNTIFVVVMLTLAGFGLAELALGFGEEVDGQPHGPVGILVVHDVPFPAK